MKVKNSKKVLSVVMIVAASLLICAGAVMAAGTALRQSNRYTSEIETPEISLALLENGKEVSGDEVLLKNLTGGEALRIGQIYDEKLSVSNTAETPQYVRMTVRKYWVENKNGKRVDLSPDLIILKTGQEGWIEDTEAEKNSSPEYKSFYYTKPLEKEQETTPAVTAVGLDSDVSLAMKQKETVSKNGKTITTTYTYDGLEFGIKVDVDGIQTHNAEQAAKSIWGVDVKVADDGTLSLK